MAATGGLATGFGQGLMGAAQAIPFAAQLKQQALQNALQQKQMAQNDQIQKNQEAAQMAGQLPGGTNISPQIYNTVFANTPAEARFTHQPGETAGQQLETPGHAMMLDPMYGMLGSDGGMLEDKPEAYQANEPYNQWAAMYRGGVSTGNNVRTNDTRLATNANTVQGAEARSIRSNSTRQKIADAGQAITKMLGEQRIAATNAHTAVERQNAETAIQRLSLAQIQLQLHGAQVEGNLRLGASRIENSPGYGQAGTLENLGLGSGPNEPDLDGIDKSIDTIMQQVGSGGVQPRPAGGATGAPRILSITPVK